MNNNTPKVRRTRSNKASNKANALSVTEKKAEEETKQTDLEELINSFVNQATFACQKDETIIRNEENVLTCTKKNFFNETTPRYKNI